MTMPNYIVNWDELRALLKEFMVPISYTSIASLIGVTKGKGFRKYIKEKTQKVEIGSWTCDSVVALSSLELYNSNNKGTISVFVNGKQIFEDINLNGRVLKTHWETLHPMNVGDKLSVICEGEAIEGAFATNIEYVDVLDNLEDLIVKKRPPKPSDKDNSRIILRVLDKLTGTPVDESSFSLFNEDNEEVGRFKATTGGSLYIDVKPDNYILKNTLIPNGYKLVPDREIVANLDKMTELILLERII